MERNDTANIAVYTKILNHLTASFATPRNPFTIRTQRLGNECQQHSDTANIVV